MVNTMASNVASPNRRNLLGKVCRTGLLNDGYSSDLPAEIFKCF